MTDKQKEYIEKNITNIENKQWVEFFNPSIAPPGMGTVLKAAGIEFLNEITNIPIRCFYKDQEISSFYVPSRIKTIDELAFYQCKNLHDVDLPNTLERIYDSAFSMCDSLTEIQLPDSLTHLGESAFSLVPLSVI